MNKIEKSKKKMSKFSENFPFPFLRKITSEKKSKMKEMIFIKISTRFFLLLTFFFFFVKQKKSVEYLPERWLLGNQKWWCTTVLSNRDRRQMSMRMTKSDDTIKSEWFFFFFNQSIDSSQSNWVNWASIFRNKNIQLIVLLYEWVQTSEIMMLEM